MVKINHGGDRAIRKRLTRVNQQIRVSPVRVIATDGTQIGVMNIQDALKLAQEENLDLVEVAPDARPPVCRIIDYGKFKYEQSKKVKEAKKKQHVVQFKEIRFRPKIDEHDYDFKMKHARRFISGGNKVRINMVFKGRENTHKELGVEILNRLAEDLSDIASVEKQSKSSGPMMELVLAPK